MNDCVSHPSLRRLFYATLALIGVPAVLVGGAAFFGMAYTTNAFQKLAEEVQVEMRPVQDADTAIQALQGLLTILPRDLAGEARQKLPQLIDEADGKIRILLEAPFNDADEIHSIGLVGAAWQDLRAGLKALPPLVANGDLAFVDSELKDLHHLLDSVLTDIEEEIRHNTQSALVIRNRLLLFVTAMLMVGFAAALLGALLLTRAVLGPLDRLHYATDQIGDGELGYRLEPERHLEFESVRRTFNWMAAELATQHQTLHSRAIHDGLTGLLNRGEFRRCLESELDLAAQRKHEVALLMIDLDHFKAINDTYGHLTGDQALVMASRAIRHVLRPSDTVGRYGGEEFTVILPHNDAAAAERVAERVLNRIRTTDVRGPLGETIRLSASIGVAACPSDTSQPEQLIEYADQALYRAKRAGRNRIERWRPPGA